MSGLKKTVPTKGGSFFILLTTTVDIVEGSILGVDVDSGLGVISPEHPSTSPKSKIKKICFMKHILMEFNFVLKNQCPFQT